MPKQEGIRESSILELKALMPTIIKDYVNNNETVRHRDCSLVIDSLFRSLHSQGVVILVEREQKYSEQTGAPIKPTKYKVLESLIQEGE